jgi:hypothetical protein
MEKEVLSNLGGVGIYGIISVCLFFTFFTGMLVWAACLRKSYLNSMRNLPLDDSERAPRTNPENSDLK